MRLHACTRIDAQLARATLAPPCRKKQLRASSYQTMGCISPAMGWCISPRRPGGTANTAAAAAAATNDNNDDEDDNDDDDDDDADSSRRSGSSGDVTNAQLQRRHQ